MCTNVIKEITNTNFFSKYFLISREVGKDRRPKDFIVLSNLAFSPIAIKFVYQQRGSVKSESRKDRKSERFLHVSLMYMQAMTIHLSDLRSFQLSDLKKDFPADIGLSLTHATFESSTKKNKHYDTLKLFSEPVRRRSGNNP